MPLYASGIYGVIIVVVMLVRPEGLIPAAAAGSSCTSSASHAGPLYDVEPA